MVEKLNANSIKLFQEVEENPHKTGRLAYSEINELPSALTCLTYFYGTIVIVPFFY